MLNSRFLLSCLLVSIVGVLSLSSGCVKKSESPSDTPAPRRTKKVMTSEALDLFETRRPFWSLVKKSLFRHNRFYSLVFTKDSVEAKLQSSLVMHSPSGREMAFDQLPAEYTLIDFDVTSSGHVIQLAFSKVGQKEGFVLKELAIFVDSKKAFIFADTKQNSAKRYNENGEAELAMPFDSNHTYFLTSSPLTQFARLQATDQKIFISATGTFGFKTFVFNYNGQEVAQTELLPQTVFNTVLVDRTAPYMHLVGHQLITAITTTRDDSLIYEKHFGINLDWRGPEFQAVVQSFNLSLENRLVQLEKSVENFFIEGVEATGNEIAVFGSSGGPGNRKALVVLLRASLDEFARSEFTLTNESTLTSAAYNGKQWIVAGSTGSVQAQTASVVEPGDAFVCAIEPDGSTKTLVRFGTDRNDQVSSLLVTDSEIYLSGILNGPITHTADADSSLGYQEWFIGKLKSPSPAVSKTTWRDHNRHLE